MAGEIAGVEVVGSRWRPQGELQVEGVGGVSPPGVQTSDCRLGVCSTDRRLVGLLRKEAVDRSIWSACVLDPWTLVAS
jgi:hypothetical protein